MKTLKYLLPTVLGLMTAQLVGCGGGGGNGTSEGALVASAIQPSSSGAYTWLITSQGLSDTKTNGLSLIHPAAPAIRHEIEPITSALTDLVPVLSGTLDAGVPAVRDIKPHSLLYIVDGDVRRIPLHANGSAPISSLKSALVNTACRFIIHANDYSAPDNSRYIVASKGVDGLCDTFDDGQLEITLDVSGGIHANAAPTKTLGVLRDPATLAPSAWIVETGLLAWHDSSLRVLRLNNDPPFRRVAIGTHNLAIAEYNTQLTVLRYDGWPNVTETRLDRALTLGTDWRAIGFDANHSYVYRNDRTTNPSTWTVLKISHTTPVATRLATGSGQIDFASMGSNLLYLTILGTTANSLISIEKSGVGGMSTLENTATSTVSKVLTSKNDVHQLWRLAGVDSASPDTTVEMLDESGSKPYIAIGGYPMLLQPPPHLDFNISENRSRFILASPYSATQGLSGASLLVYDTDTRAIRTLGSLPGTSNFGDDFVFAAITPSASDFMAGFAGRVVSGVLKADSIKTFTFDITAQGSLR